MGRRRHAGRHPGQLGSGSAGHAGCHFAGAFALTEASDKLPLPTKILYGFGASAYGIKDNGFSVFLLYYYNQVVGMRADVVSLAIAIALFVDAFIDPLIGQMTDRTRTPIGVVTRGSMAPLFPSRLPGCYYGTRRRPAPRCNSSIC
ncbi:hypothetical protein C8024_15040 [Sphingopyxis sp. BSNA05]|nr:hypothetical protein [Sphingopyxis sp. BSNA05]